MPVPPAELAAHYTIAGPDAASEAAAAVAGPSGIAHEGGPGETLLAGSRAEVLAARDAAVGAALDAGVRELDVKLEAPTESRG